MERHGVRVVLQLSEQLSRAVVGAPLVEREEATHGVGAVCEVAFALVESLEVDEWPEAFAPEGAQRGLVLLALQNCFEEKEFDDLLGFLIDAELVMGQVENAVELVAVVSVVVHHVREVDARRRETTLHAYEESVDKHLVTQSACHLYQSHGVNLNRE